MDPKRWRRAALFCAVALTFGLCAKADLQSDLPVGDRAASAVAGEGFRAAPTPAEPRGYATLLRRLDLPADRQTYGDFCDYGYWSGTSYAGFSNLPAGYWVYLAPTWYIYKDQSPPAPGRAEKRAWGPEQAVGAPDTWPRDGDLQSAWASKTPDDQPEWLELTYAHPSRPIAVLVYETFNPGAVTRVTGFDAAGKAVELWTGVDPTATDRPAGVSVIPVHADFDVVRIRIDIDSPKVKGWNEIDAVGLLDDAGATQWADSATASSTYAEEISSTDTLGSKPAIERLND